MELLILRGVFLLVAFGIGTALHSEQVLGAYSWVCIPLMMLAALAVVGIDIAIKRKRIDLVSSVYFGLVVGLFLTYVISLALTPMFVQLGQELNMENIYQLRFAMIAGPLLCYLCITLLYQTKDDFRFLIPYVEFSREVKGAKPYILDTSVVIDGRIADIVETGIFDNQLIMPRFVLAELQAIADSSDKMRRSRGRRGLDILNRLRSNSRVDLQVYDREFPEMEGQPVDTKLLLLARHLQGKVVTGDYNLNKVARLQNVPVINLNDIANSLKPVFLPGELIQVQVVKAGEEPGQGIGYLEDGTMIVIEEGRNHIGNSVAVTVTSMLQTSAGRMVFGRYEKGK